MTEITLRIGAIFILAVPIIGTNSAFVATQNCTYDSLNRIKQATETIPNQTGWQQTFVYDRYGNRRFDTTPNATTTLDPNCPVAVCNPQIDPTSNKLIGYQFDNSGNTKTDAENRSFIYDSENKQVEVRDASNNLVGQYFYNGDGQRIKKTVPGGETTVFVYDASNKLVAEYSTIVAPQATAKTSYLTKDHLGSPRITTDSLGRIISRRDFMPFGEEIQRASYGSDSIRQKFTGYERDNESELDYAQFRYLNPRAGRFSSADPLMASALRDNPQTFNRYTYVLNNPLTLVDPWGLKPVFLRRTDENGELTEVMRADDEDEGFEELLKSWQRVEFNDNGEYSYLASDENGNQRTAILKSDGTWGWAPSGTVARVLTGAGAVGFAGSIAGTEELPGPGTIIGGVAGAVIGGILAATTAPSIIEQTGAPAIPVTRATPLVTPTPSQTPCGPCRTVSGRTVPIGTIGYRPLDNVPLNQQQHGIWGPHHNIYRSAQAPLGTPQPCRCFWVPVGAVPPPPPPGSIPIEEFIYPN